MKTTTTLYLIRHGETDWNLNGRWQGYTDVSLNAVGRTQARRLAARLRAAGTHFDAIYSSDLQRAWETARAIGSALGIEPRTTPALREINVGSWSGMTNAEVSQRDADTYERLRSGEDVARGGGERFLDLYTRVVDLAEQLIGERPGTTLALVTHGGPVRALILHAARDKSGFTAHRVAIGNTSLTVLIHDGAGWDFGPINDMAHLEAGLQASALMSAPPDDAERP